MTSRKTPTLKASGPGQTWSPAWLSVLLATAMTGCTARQPPLEALEREIELERFMGRWYVLAHIPIDNVFASEADAYNAIEEYELAADGSIRTTYTFRAGAFDGPERRFTPVGHVHDQRTATEWRMQFVWPFKSAYLIAYLDDEYERTIIGVPDRSYAWIMARRPTIPEDEYAELLTVLGSLGYQTDKLRRVPHRW